MKTVLCITCLFFTLNVTNARAEEQNKPPAKTSIAVMGLKANGVPETTANMATVVLQTEFINSGRFIVLERERIDMVISEKKMQKSLCDTNQCAAEIGRLMLADKILLGEVSRAGETILITVRVVDVEEGISEFAEYEKAAGEGEIDRAVAAIVKRLTDRVLYLKPPSKITVSRGDHLKKVELRWEGSKESERYFVYRSAEKNGEYARIGNTTGTAFTDGAVEPGREYWYRVRGWSYNGYTEFSAPETGYARKPPVPVVKPKKASPPDGMANPVARGNLMVGSIELYAVEKYGGTLFKPKYHGMENISGINTLIAPELYYFIVNNVAVGGTLRYEQHKYNNEIPFPADQDQKYTTNYFHVKAGMRFFYGAGRFIPYIGTSYRYDYNKMKYTYSDPWSSGSLYFIETSHGVVFELGMNIITWRSLALFAETNLSFLIGRNDHSSDILANKYDDKRGNSTRIILGFRFFI